jgi:CCR4-NOT transcription complex subunit 6
MSLEGNAEIIALRILQDPPVENCELRPFVLLRDHKGNQAPDNEELKYKWLRGQKRVCSLQRCTGGATIQCVYCLKLRRPAHMTFFCSREHFAQAWPTHKELHVNPKQGLGGELAWLDDDCETEDLRALVDEPKRLNARFPPPLANIWAEVASTKLYTPRSDDVGRMLRLEVGNGAECAAWLDTSSVLPEPEAPPARNMNYARIPGSGSFKVFTYNILADIYATRARYHYCPLWSLLWTYRRNNILREILNAKADIICLQEVQADHFEDFIYPKLKEAGYEGLFKAKTRMAMSDNPKQIDGCAIFYREDKFALTEQYSFEFNEAARMHVEQQQQRLGRQVATNYQNSALKRLCKGNIALIVVLEDISVESARTRGARRKRRLCVANTHIFWDPEYPDVKLWQALSLCQELEKFGLNRTRNIPLILCGDFNSTPDSPVYHLLEKGAITDSKVFEFDEYHVLPPLANMIHRLPLRSAYAEINGEPKYTNFTAHFVGVLDYIWYTTASLKCIGVLKVDDEQTLQEYTALPSPRYPSDHIHLLAEYEWTS